MSSLTTTTVHSAHPVISYFAKRLNTPVNTYSLPKPLKRLIDNIHVIKLDDQNIGNLTIMLINDENTETSTIGFSAPVGYFNEQNGNFPNGMVYTITSTILIDAFFKNKDLMNLRARVEPEVSYWTSQTSSKKKFTAIGNVWEKITRFKSEQISSKLVESIGSE